MAPHPDSVEAVESWLSHHGLKTDDITFRSGGGEWIVIPMTISQAETMLGAKYGLYRHSNSSSYVVRTLSYSLPRELHNHINVVSPTTYFGTLRSMKATHFIQSDGSNEVGSILSPEAVPPRSCASQITPACLKVLYNS